MATAEDMSNHINTWARLFTACGFLLALLSFLDKRNNKRKK